MPGDGDHRRWPSTPRQTGTRCTRLLADEAICIGPAPSTESYLDYGADPDSATRCHEGRCYPSGLRISLRERPLRGALCRSAISRFIGPSAEIINKMGNKSEARKTMMAAGVPVVPGSKEPVILPWRKALRRQKEIGFPVMIKASSGGGGKGMRISRSEEDFEPNFLQCPDGDPSRAFPMIPCISSGLWRIRATSSFRFWQTAMEMWSIWESATARSRGVTRRCLRNLPVSGDLRGASQKDGRDGRPRGKGGRI